MASSCSVEWATSKWPGETALEAIENAADVAAADAVVGHHDVGGQDGQGGGQRPRVQVVHRGHFVEFEEMSAHLLEVDVLRRGLQKDAQRRDAAARTAALSMSATTTSEAMESARLKPVVTMTIPATTVPMNP